MAEQYKYYLTTRDNPFDPQEQQDAWRLYDKMNHYDTEETLERFTKTSDELSDSDKEFDIAEAMLRIIARDPFNMYIRVKKPIREDVDVNE